MVLLRNYIRDLNIDRTKMIGALGQYFRTSLIHLEATL